MLTQRERERVGRRAYALEPKKLNKKLKFSEKILIQFRSDAENLENRIELFKHPEAQDMFLSHEQKGITTMQAKMLEWLKDDIAKVQDIISIYKSILYSRLN